MDPGTLPTPVILEGPGVGDDPLAFPEVKLPKAPRRVFLLEAAVFVSEAPLPAPFSFPATVRRYSLIFICTLLSF